MNGDKAEGSENQFSLSTHFPRFLSRPTISSVVPHWRRLIKKPERAAWVPFQVDSILTALDQSLSEMCVMREAKAVGF